MQAVLAKDHPGGTEQRPSVVARCGKGSGRPSGLKYFDMLLTDADQKERIAPIQQSIAELSALTNDKK